MRQEVPRVFITGSADGLGRAAAHTLLDEGHEVVVHARHRDRLAAMGDLRDRGAAAVVGDLSDLEETRDVSDQVNRLGALDAVIHNAGVGSGPQVLPVNVVAPYLLTALISRPKRLVYLSSSMHRGGRADLTDVDWSGRHARIRKRAPPAVTGITSAGRSRTPGCRTSGFKTNYSKSWLASPGRALADPWVLAKASRRRSRVRQELCHGS